MVRKMKKLSTLVVLAIIALAAIVVGSVFTFGMQYWNAKVEYDSCITVQDKFVEYEKLYRRTRIREIVILCESGNKYFLDGAAINSKHVALLDEMQKYDNIIIKLHPHSNSVVEINVGEQKLLEFDETIAKLQQEATGFLILGIFMYFCSFAILTVVIVIAFRKVNSSKEKKNKK